MAELLINIDVPDLDRGIAFYSQGLSWVFVRALGTGVAELDAGNCRAYLLRNAAGTVSSPHAANRRDYHRHWTPVHFDLAVPDLSAAMARAQAAGAAVETGPRINPWGTIATLADPFGNGFCLIEFSEAGYDAVADAPQHPL